MIEDIRSVIDFISKLITQIFNIKIVGNLTIGITIIILVIIYVGLKFMFGGKGD